jgi:hypothetical protein
VRSNRSCGAGGILTILGGYGELVRGAGGRVFREELGVDLADDAEVISGYHENGGFYGFAEGTTGFFQDDPDVLKGLPGLVFEIVAHEVSGITRSPAGRGANRGRYCQ